MLFNFNFYSSLLLVFFVHGMVYTLLCFRKSRATENNSFAWLGLYLLLCTLYIAPWMVGFAGWYDNQPYRDILLYTPTNYSWMLGPVMFVYVQSLLNPSYRFSRKEWWHFLPGAIYLLFHLLFFITDKLILTQPFFLSAEVDPDYTDYSLYPGMISMVIYFLLTLRYYRLYQKLMVQLVSFADLLLFKWVRNFLYGFLGFILITITFTILGAVFGFYYTGSWWYYLAFALIYYYIAITGYSNATETHIAFQANLLTYRPALILQPSSATNHIIEIDFIEIEPREATAFEPDFPLEEWKEKIEQAIDTEKGYEDPDLNLMKLSKQLGTNPSLLSKIINQGFRKNFNDFINGYRIEAVLQKLNAREQEKHTLLSLAYECGFNSKATFNRAFRKYAGLSPKEWIEKNAS